MQCPHCGAELPGDSNSCSACGQALANPPSDQEISQPGIVRRKAVYAGFWLRAFAIALDLLILCVVLVPTVIIPVLDRNHINPQDAYRFTSGGSKQGTALTLLLQLFFWLYFASFESSVWQATPGKKAFGLVVTDLQGRKLSFLHATARHFAKFISQLTLLIGYVIAGFTAKKQALHDIIAGCLVLRKI